MVVHGQGRRAQGNQVRKARERIPLPSVNSHLKGSPNGEEEEEGQEGCEEDVAC